MTKSIVIRFSILAAIALGFGALSVRADLSSFTYYDVIGNNDLANANTYSTVSNAVDWDQGGDGSFGWRFRNTGPGVPAYGTSAFTGRYLDSDPALYTSISGLLPNTAYYVLVYGVYPNNTYNPSGGRYGAEFSLDGGTTWSLIDNRGANTNMINWVDNSSGLGSPLAGIGTGDTRFWMEIPGTVITDESGVARIDIRLPQLLSNGSAQDKFNLDGYALSTSPVPEPTTCALVGLGLLAFAVRRRK